MEEIEILKINEQAAQIPGCIRFDRGSTHLPFPEEFISLLDEVKRDITGQHFGYPAIGGEIALKEGIVMLEKENGRTVSPEDIVITHGGMSGIYSFLGIVAEPGDEIIVHEYAFEGFFLAIHALGLIEKRANLSDQQSIEEAITEKTRAIIINSPENPTGKVYTQSEIDAIVEVARKRNIPVLSDEVTDRILYEHTVVAYPSLAGGHVVAINSFSKNWFVPGIRVGWLVSKNTELIARIKNFLSIQSVGVNLFGQLLMAKTVALGEYQKFLSSRIEILAEKRELMKRLFDENGIPYISNPQGGMNFYIDTGEESRIMAARLLTAHGVALIPGDIFEGRSSRYARVGFGSVEEDEIARGVTAIALAMGDTVK